MIGNRMTALEYPSWEKLRQHAQTASKFTLRQLFAANRHRAEIYSLEAAGLFLDYSKNLINDTTIELFQQLAREAELKQAITNMLDGGIVNSTENRAALHTLLRADPTKAKDNLNTHANLVANACKQIKETSQAIRLGSWKGYSGNTIKDIVHIGIGGSYLGPYMLDEALEPYRTKGKERDICCHYVANIDAHHITQLLQQLEPANTVIIIVSKSFTTLETKINAATAKQWLLTDMELKDLSKHLIGITANTSAATQFGIAAKNVLPLWDWVGGRYSLWSAVSLPIAIRYGFDAFEQLLQGAAAMDEHFSQTELSANMPMILACLGLWYQHFFNANSHAVLTYDHGLRYFADHLQQLDMESNGKSVKLNGAAVDYPTGPIVWGGEGSNGQHAYHQLLHQGTHFVSLDFILPLKPHHHLKEHHDWLVASCFSQSQALMLGRQFEQIEQNNNDASVAQELTRQQHKSMPGNRPSNTLLLNQVTPHSLGALTALYEHKVFCQAVILQINPFDQWGVELGKELSQAVYSSIQTGEAGLDASTNSLTARYRKTFPN
ncbi:MAG: glucose-6-phosphate isomerase [Pseudomonadales bacterium]|nr:glucose-6-phosphate isomerase [Pseudomonadales bacterium]